MELREKYRWRVRTNAYRNTLREKAARVMRGLADRLDRRISLAVEIDTAPALPEAVKARCVRMGLQEMERIVGLAVAEEARDRLFERAHPELAEGTR